METELGQLIHFLHETERLKFTLRKYSLSSGRQESTAEHSWRLGLMSFLVAEQLNLKIDIKKSIELAIVHDLAEAYCGDFDALKVYDGRIKQEDKEKIEDEAIQEIIAHLPKKLANKVYSLWKEYEDSLTPEAKYIKALDKIESTLGYIETDPKKREGTDHVAGHYSDPKVEAFPELKPLLIALKKDLKKAYEDSGAHWEKEYESTD